ncbi:hypothetical protein FRB93_007084 [Tulasnella sp. JGI-2019a]|nr:hypothetical protein FRB93_007084 [Tulasnella sp. JGI-2019a]
MQLQSLIGDGHEWWLSAAESNLFLDIVIKHKTEANAAELDAMFENPKFPLSDLKKADSIIPLSSPTPVVIHALKSNLPPVFGAAYQLLGKVGTDAWEPNVGPRAGRPLVIVPDLGCALIQSLSTNAMRKDFSLFEFAVVEHSIDIEGLLHWLAESVREDATLGPDFGKSGIVSLFISCIRDKTWSETSGAEDSYMWTVTFLFLRVWSTSPKLVEAFALDDDGIKAFATEASFRGVCEYLKQYAQSWMTRLGEDPTNRDMYQRTFAFIEQVYHLRPEYAVALELDGVCNALVWVAEDWEEARSISLYWDAALKAAAGAGTRMRYLQDSAREARWRKFKWWIQDVESKVEAGWWKLGGLSRVCQQPCMR